MARNLGSTQVTLSTEHRSWEIVFSLPRGGVPQLFIRREAVKLQDGVVYERRELPAVVVTRDMLTPAQQSTLAGVLAAIDNYADQIEEAEEA